MAALLEVARRRRRGGTPHEVLWAVWDASGLAGQWQAASAAGGSRGAVADADLDAVVALFDAAARFTARLPHGSTRLFLDSLAGQEIAGDTLAEPRAARRGRGRADRAPVQGPGVGPGRRGRRAGGHLARPAPARLAAGHGRACRRRGRPGGEATGAAPRRRPPRVSELLAEERRLFYVAVTRARRALVVTAVGAEDAEERPSRFLAELAGDEIEIERVAGAGGSWLSLPALTADLRRAAADAALPGAGAGGRGGQLARLAAAGVRGASPRALVRADRARPRPASRSPAACQSRPRGWRRFTRCGLRWLLEAAVGVRSPGAAQHLGIVIHAAAALAAEGADDGEVAKRIDELWQHLDFGSAWYSARQRGQAETMVAKFLDWHRDNPRELVAVEQELARRARARSPSPGQVDRLERDDDGAAIVVDLKTGTGRPSDADLDRNPQLGVYQLAVMLGAFEQLGLTEPGGAELVQVGKAGAEGQRPGAGAAQPARATPSRGGRGSWSRRSRPGWRGRCSRRRPTPAAGSARWLPAARSTSAAGR